VLPYHHPNGAPAISPAAKGWNDLMFEGLAWRRLALSAAAVALAVPVAGQAEARSWSVTGRNGGTWNRSVSHYNHGGGNVGRTATTTRPDGQTATRTFDRSVNGGTITDSRTVTGYNGGTASRTVTRTPGVGGSVTYTGPAGRTYSETYVHGPCCWGAGTAAAVAVGAAVGVAAAEAHPYVAPPAVIVPPPPPVVYAPAYYP
jgi:hypothetical protein